MMHARAFIFLAEGFEEIEAIAPADILRRSTREVKLVSISNTLEVRSAHQITIKADMTWETFVSQYAESLNENREKTALVFPGGLPGAENLAACAPLMELAKKHWAENGLLCAICASPGTILPNSPLQVRNSLAIPDLKKTPLLAVLHTPVKPVQKMRT